MTVDDCFYLGYVSKTIGTKGELAFKLDVDSPSSYTALTAVLLQIHPKDVQLVPFFITASSLQNDQLLRCSIEGVINQSEAKNLVGKALFLPLNQLPRLKDDQFYFHEIIDYTVVDEDKGNIGYVEKVLEYSTSNLLSVNFQDKEILIPISDETIVGVDKKNKQLKVKCPEGLIDLYLES